MMPKYMETFLREALPKRTWGNRLQRDGALRFMEFGPLDVDRLQRLGIAVDRLGPYLVVCLWDAESPLEIGGYLVVDNLAMGRPSMGGIRMLPDVTPSTIHNLARGMTLKNAAAELPYGGGKCGIVAPGRTVTSAEHTAIVAGFARLIRRYRTIYLPGPDVGTNDEDMKTIAIENGLNNALSKTVDMGGNRIDQLGGAGQGVVVAIDTFLEEMPRLRALPQFATMEVPPRHAMRVLIQGFGAVGTHVARILTEGEPGHTPRITGISDQSGYLYAENGLPVDNLLQIQRQEGVVALPYFRRQLEAAVAKGVAPGAKFSTYNNDLLRESAFCVVPAAPVANYLDVEAASNPSITVARMGEWSMIVEGANTYSPDPTRRAARIHMERSVYWQKGVLIATDFLVNSGGVIYAAQEHLIPAPEHLTLPQAMLGDRAAVEGWLAEHAREFAELAEKRRAAGDAWVRRVIRCNMQELVDRLLADSDLLPLEAAEAIAISRITSGERGRTVGDVMEPVPIIDETATIRQAAETLVAEKGDLLAVVAEDGQLTGVVTDWDITKAAAAGYAAAAPVTEIMTREVIYAYPTESIVDVVRKLEHFEISAMLVVTEEDGAGVDAAHRVAGVVSSDILARRTLYRLLQAQG
jgi:glutamate dehydrogenase/leucine dehydrogenase/CBS domain-containing protein